MAIQLAKAAWPSPGRAVGIRTYPKGADQSCPRRPAHTQSPNNQHRHQQTHHHRELNSAYLPTYRHVHGSVQVLRPAQTPTPWPTICVGTAPCPSETLRLRQMRYAFMAAASFARSSVSYVFSVTYSRWLTDTVQAYPQLSYEMHLYSGSVQRRRRQRPNPVSGGTEGWDGWNAYWRGTECSTW